MSATDYNTSSVRIECSKVVGDPYWQADAHVDLEDSRVESSARSYSRNKALAYALEGLAAQILKEEVR